MHVLWRCSLLFLLWSSSLRDSQSSIHTSVFLCLFFLVQMTEVLVLQIMWSSVAVMNLAQKLLSPTWLSHKLAQWCRSGTSCSLWEILGRVRICVISRERISEHVADLSRWCACARWWMRASKWGSSSLISKRCDEQMSTLTTCQSFDQKTVEVP